MKYENRKILQKLFHILRFKFYINLHGNETKSAFLQKDGSLPKFSAKALEVRYFKQKTFSDCPIYEEGDTQVNIRPRLHEYAFISFSSKPQTFLCVFTLHLHESDQNDDRFH